MPDGGSNRCLKCGAENVRGIATCSACGNLLIGADDFETYRAGEVPLPPPVSDSPAAAPAAPVTPAAGPEMWGPFRLIEKVGQGSFGEVYRAFDTTLEREVAVKLLTPRGPADTGGVAAVLREARTMAKVRHPNVVPVYGVDTFSGRVGFWSDFVHGRTLTDLVAVQGRFGAKEAALIGLDVCKAVNAVHAAGLLHRDIKGSNVMREDGGRILLMDFGLSLSSAERQSPGGTPAYMAPELFSGGPATIASDIYAIGVLLFYLLTAKFPVDVRRVTDPAARRSLHDERTDLPEALVAVVSRATDVDPKQRYQSAGQLLAALTEAAGIAPGNTTPLPAAAAPSPRTSRVWLLAPVLVAIAIAGWFTPLRSRLMPKSAGPAPGAHADYLRAQDLLDHYYQPKSLDQAIPLFEQTIAEDPRFALAYTGLCRAYLQQFRDLDDPALIQKSQDACTKAISIDRDLAPAHVTLGQLYTQTSHPDLASQELQEAMKLDNKSAEAWAAMADLYNRQGRSADALQALQKATDLAPADWRWLNQLGAYQLNDGKFAEAARAFEQAAKLTPDNPRVWSNLGIANRRMGRFADAETALKRALDLDPQSRYLLNLGLIYEQQGKDREAAALYERATELNPSSYLAFANLASVYDRIPDDKPKARDAYLKAISLAEELRKSNPKDASLLAQLGSYYATVGMGEKSVPLLRQAAALAPDDPQVLYRAAEGYELLKNRDEALRWIRQALAHGFSADTLRRNPEMRGLLADPRFATIANTR